jgi:hypothetical protein
MVIGGALQGEVAGRPFHSRAGEVVPIAKGTLHTVEDASLEPERARSHDFGGFLSLTRWRAP